MRVGQQLKRAAGVGPPISSTSSFGVNVPSARRHRPVPDDLRPAAGRGTSPRRRGAEPAPEAGLLLDLAERGGLLALAVDELALREAPVVVAGAMHEQRPRAPPRSPRSGRCRPRRGPRSGSFTSRAQLLALARFQTAGHPARATLGGACSMAASSPGDERLGDRRPSRPRSHASATTASWCSPSTSWRSAAALANIRAAFPKRGATASAAYRAPLRADPRLVERRDRSPRAGARSTPAELVPGLAHQAAELVGGASRGGRPSGGVGRAPHRRGASGRHARYRRPHRAQQPARPSSRRASRFARRRSSAAVVRPEEGTPSPGAGPKHLGVADHAERRAEGLQLLSKTVAPPPVEDRAEGAQVRAETSGRDARLVDGLRILAEPDAPIVVEEARDRPRDRRPDDVLDVGVLARLLDDEARQRRRLAVERATARDPHVRAARSAASACRRSCAFTPRSVGTFDHVPVRRQLPRQHVVLEQDLEDLVQASCGGRGPSTGTMASTRRSRLRGIRSAEPME